MTDWTTCRVVQDRDDDLWTNYAGMWHTPEIAPFSADMVAKYAPITPILDADGLPVVRTVGDLTARHTGRRVRVGTEGAEGSLDALDIGRHRFVVYLIGADAVHVLGGLTPDTPCEVLDD